MSISPAQFAMVLGATGPEQDLGTPPVRATQTAIPVAEPSAEGTTESSGPTLSTALRIDDQRRIYYEVINNRTGDVIMQIPPELIRKLGEALDAAAPPKAHSVDVKT